MLPLMVTFVQKHGRRFRSPKLTGAGKPFCGFPALITLMENERYVTRFLCPISTAFGKAGFGKKLKMCFLQGNKVLRSARVLSTPRLSLFVCPFTCGKENGLSVCAHNTWDLVLGLAPHQRPKSVKFTEHLPLMSIFQTSGVPVGNHPGLPESC